MHVPAVGTKKETYENPLQDHESQEISLMMKSDINNRQTTQKKVARAVEP